MTSQCCLSFRTTNSQQKSTADHCARELYVRLKGDPVSTALLDQLLTHFNFPIASVKGVAQSQQSPSKPQHSSVPSSKPSVSAQQASPGSSATATSANSSNQASTSRGPSSTAASSSAQQKPSGAEQAMSDSMSKAFEDMMRNMEQNSSDQVCC
jgi:hypothetical protein